jgi:hypothetical protein
MYHDVRERLVNTARWTAPGVVVTNEGQDDGERFHRLGKESTPAKADYPALAPRSFAEDDAARRFNLAGH